MELVQLVMLPNTWQATGMLLFTWKYEGWLIHHNNCTIIDYVLSKCLHLHTIGPIKTTLHYVC